MSVILPGTQVAGIAQEATTQSIKTDTAALVLKDFATQATLEDVLVASTATNTLTQFIATALTGASGVTDTLLNIESNSDDILTGVNSIETNIDNIVTGISSIDQRLSTMSQGLFTKAFDTIELISATGIYDVFETSKAAAAQQQLTITYADATKQTATKWVIIDN